MAERPVAIKNGTNQGALCAENAGFSLLIGNYDDYCEQGTGGNWIDLDYGSFNWLINNSGYQVLLAENSNGTGWQGCFSHGNAYELLGTEYENADGIEITHNGAACSSNAVEGQCVTNGGMAWVPDACMYSGYYYEGDESGEYETPINVMTNASGYRVWMHEYSNNTGWADCFTNNNAYQVYGSQDESPGNIQVTTNSSNC